MADTDSAQEYPRLPLHELVGIPNDTSQGWSDNGDTFRLEIPLSDELRGAAFPVHGGIFGTLIDVACANCAVGSTAMWERGAVPVTTETHIRYLRQPRRGPLITEAKIAHRGRRLITVDCTVTDGEGRKLALASATYMVIEGAVPSG
jgi:uncharacterized protein (TIGR00369 family)